ncbi:MAG: family 2 glycosyl transferase [Desulfobulbus propionicus]|nr:MAG: family 2 glycosyl transferase [Desulfobulbus propionicus]
MRLTLIVTTYNWKEALKVCLQSAISQAVLPDEIIVADDGSGEDTARVVEEIQEVSPVPLLHSWQKDKGFRLARSRNRAIAKASGDYIVLIDGDILLHRDFIGDHRYFAARSCFSQGTRVLLNENFTKQVLRNGTAGEISAFSPGLGNRKNCIRIESRLARYVSRKNKKLSGIRTCNFAFWREDAIMVNGFNEEFIGWGREDSEFTARLMNSGVCRQNIRFNAVVYHLFHPMNNRERLENNNAILRRTVEGRHCWCRHGLRQHL